MMGVARSATISARKARPKPSNRAADDLGWARHALHHQLREVAGLVPRRAAHGDLRRLSSLRRTLALLLEGGEGKFPAIAFLLDPKTAGAQQLLVGCNPVDEVGFRRRRPGQRIVEGAVGVAEDVVDREQAAWLQ